MNEASAALRNDQMLNESTGKLPALNPPTILVVDDFDDTRCLLRTWLERKGFRVIEAENGNEAVSEAESKIPDLIIMDVEMPELDGLSATRMIRASGKLPGVPIVAVSAYGSDRFRGMALQAGCDEYVSTPFEPADLERLIRSYLHLETTKTLDQ
jgi:CheY-like chemotaxis protein